MRTARMTLPTAALLAVALLLPACSSKKKQANDNKRATPGSASKGDRYGGNLRLHSNQPAFLNPVLQTRFERVNTLIFEGLVGLDSRLEPTPRLADSWQISESGKIITFQLRKNVKWHDGKPFTAQDVKFTYDAIMNTTARTLWKAYMEAVDSVEITDDHTVVIVYKRPYALALTAWTVGIIPKHAYDMSAKKDAEGIAPDITESPANKEPVGTGPFKFGHWVKGERIVLLANNDWWFGRPYLDSVQVMLELSDAEVMKGLRTGQLDFVEIPDIKTWTNEAQLPEFQERFEVRDVVEASFQVIAWNLGRDLFDDARVRLGLTHALDRGRVVDDVFAGQARLLSAPFFPNMFGPDPSIAPHPFDLDRAVKLLDAAGHKSVDGRRFQLELLASTSSKGDTTNAVLAIFRHDLAAIGIEFKVTYVSPAEFDDRIVLRDFDAAYFGWLPDIPDPDPYALLHSSQISVGSIHAGYASPEVDRLLDDARATNDRDERKAIYHKVHAILHKDLPYTVLYSDYGHYAYRRELRGVNPNDVGPQPRFPGLARWWISKRDDGSAVAKPAR